MNDKEKQIEELTKELDYCETHDCIGESCAKCRAIWLIENGYRKIPKGSIVISKEEYEALLLEQKRLREIVDRIPCGYELKDHARKETAKEICEMGENLYKMSYHKSSAMPRLVAWIKSNFGVEIKE